MKSIYNSMASAGLRIPFKKILPYWASPTIARFKDLAVTHPQKFDGYVRLIEGYVDLSRKQGITAPFTLHLPSLKEMIAIDIVSLLNNESAKRDIQKFCYKPTQGMINLRPLVTLNSKYMEPANI